MSSKNKSCKFGDGAIGKSNTYSMCKLNNKNDAISQILD